MVTPPFPISERTVELNLTAELLRWLRRWISQDAIVVGPSTVDESRLAYDAEFDFQSVPLLIQYKRASPEPNDELHYKLNDTKKKEQHARLLWLELQGLVVYYALPYFIHADRLRQRMYWLLVDTAWWPPSWLTMPLGSLFKRHTVVYETRNDIWWMKSKKKQLARKPHAPKDLRDQVTRREPLSKEKLTRILERLRQVSAKDFVEDLTTAAGETPGSVKQGTSINELGPGTALFLIPK